MAKKKKPAANPARGFATTSIASKSKTENTEAEIIPVHTDKHVKPESYAESKQHPKSQPAKSPERAESPPKFESQNLTDLTPNDLEKKLEDDELQLFVDKYAEKCARDASRHVQRLLSERRLLRSHEHTHSLYLPAILGQDIIDRVVELEKTELMGTARLQRLDQSRHEHQHDSDVSIQRLWTLQRALDSIGFNEHDRDKALNYAAENTESWSSSSSAIWGLDECIHWLVLQLDGESLPDFDATIPRSEDVLDLDTDESTSAGAPRKGTEVDVAKSQAITELSQSEALTASNATEDEANDSDIETDVEPDQLPNIYLEIKSRLYNLAPELVEVTKGNKTPKTTGPSTKGDQPESNRVKRLITKMNRIESDPLFDKGSAEERWTLRRNEMARENAERKKLGIEGKHSGDTSLDNSQEGQADQTDALEQHTHGESEDEGQSFAALFESVPADDAKTEIGNDSITIRDFGKPSGLSPRRILEESIRSRDPKAEILYKHISAAAFSSRHSIKIVWSKRHPNTIPIDIPGVLSQATTQSHHFRMETVATPDTRQSEAYVSVVALFQIFLSSAKEAKAHIRLPIPWRDLWQELAIQFKKENDSANREIVRKLKRKLNHIHYEYHSGYLESAKRDEISSNQAKISGEEGHGNQLSKQSGLSNEEDLKLLWHSRAERSAFKHFLDFRRGLPMFQFRDTALSALEENQVIIISGETGCGKSTQMPSYILENELTNGRSCRIYCTEPRRISAITLAQRVSQELGESKNELGTTKSLVGYSIRLESKVSSSSRLIYATTGIVLRMLESLNGLRGITHIVIDEVHERSIETDFLLIILRTLIKRRPELKVILMSATLNAKKFADYFGGAPVLNVPGRTFPVESKFLEDALELTNYVPERFDVSEEETDSVQEDDADHETGSGDKQLVSYSEKTRKTLANFDQYKIDFSLIMHLLEKITSDQTYEAYVQAILVFLPGIGEIRRLSAMLQGASLAQTYIIHTLHSAIASEDQQRAFQPPPRGYGKIILATNIAETGVTIPDVTCVVDVGKHKEMRFDERRQISRLIESFISRANAKQRRGRAGRVQAGVCFHLFTRARHDNSMLEEQTPEMLRLSLQDLVMRVKSCKLGDIQNTLASALDPPSEKNIRRAIDTLKEVGALTSNEDLTQLGIHLSKLPLDPYLGKLTVNGVVFGCLDICLTLAAILTSKSPFLAAVENKNQTTSARASFFKGTSDLITDFNAYASWRRTCIRNPQSERSFCRKNLLSMQTLATVEDMKAQLILSLSETGLVTLNSSERSEIMRIANSGSSKRRFVSISDTYNSNSHKYDVANGIFAMSFYPKIMTRDGKGWRNIATNQQISIHPASVLRSSPDALSARTKLLSYYSILQTSTGTRHYNATGLNAVPAVLLALLAGEASLLPVSQAVSLDNGRVRFAVDADTPAATWYGYMVLRALRRYAQRLKRSKLRTTPAANSDEEEYLERWMEVWNEFLRRCNSIEGMTAP